MNPAAILLIPAALATIGHALTSHWAIWHVVVLVVCVWGSLEGFGSDREAKRVEAYNRLISHEKDMNTFTMRHRNDWNNPSIQKTYARMEQTHEQLKQALADAGGDTSV